MNQINFASLPYDFALNYVQALFYSLEAREPYGFNLSTLVFTSKKQFTIWKPWIIISDNGAILLLSSLFIFESKSWCSIIPDLKIDIIFSASVK